MADGRKDLFRCSTIKIPTVLGLLKDVLTQYPDNGQILKELVQNAEDAEATTFEVLHDSRSYTSSSEILGKFTEGPALCVYNDAVFTEKDWDGIRMLSDSFKRNDPLKVGQFGLGFKSVFHFTDYVTIISGNNVMFMDPSEAQDKMCRELSLVGLPEFFSVDECLYFWGQYLERDCIYSGHFPGTLFWFPLRKQPSKLSSTVYRQTNVENLFKSFGVEASLCLTFLKSLESICIKKVSGNNVPVDILRVNITSSSWSDTQERRRKFREQLQQCKGFSSDPIVSKYEITVKLCGKDIPECQQQYKVLHYLQAADKPEKAGQISHMPLVGIAAPVPPVRSNCQGHIFCFLPLPLDSANHTNLPFQMNGYFVLDQNRRHVKWRTLECNSEPNVNWNEDLVENVVADAYLLFLKYELKLVTDGDSPKDVWYSFLPHIASTSGRWNVLARKMWKQLIQLPILYSDTRNQMMLPKDVINSSNLNKPIHRSTSQTIWKVLADLQIPLVALPEHVLSALRDSGAEPKPVTPQLIRSYLKTNIIRDDWNKHHLLEYVMSDAQYQDLEGLPLLPLKNGNSIAFRNQRDTVFICSSEEQEALLGVDSQLLGDDLPVVILQHFRTMASRNFWQLRIFSASSHLIEMLPKCVQYVQSTPLTHQQLEPWLQHVWDLLQCVNLQKLESLAVLPSEYLLSPTSFISLSSAFVVQEYPMSRARSEVLQLLTIKVLPTLPKYIRHPELHRYLGKPDDEGIHQALERVLFHHNMDSLANRFNSCRSNEGRLEFCNILCKVKYIKPNVLCFLQKLHLFKAVHGYNVADVNIEAVDKIFPQITDFPVGSPEQLIQPCNSSVQQLAQKLGAVQLNKVDLCLLALQNRYSGNDAMKLGWYILKDKTCTSVDVWQLRISSASSNLIEMLPKCVQYVQSTPLTHQQLEPWLQNVWDLLQCVNLQKVESLAVLPSEYLLSPTSFISLSSAFVVQECPMSRARSEVLQLLKIKVLPTLPKYIRHPELHRYLGKPDDEEIHQALERVLFHHNMDSLANRFNSCRSNEGRLEFCSILCKVENIKPNVLRFLQKLHLFKAVHGYNVTDVNIEAVSKIFPQITDFPLGSPEPLILPCNSSVQQLAQKLGAVQLNKVDLCLLALQHQYSGIDAMKLGWYIVKDKTCTSVMYKFIQKYKTMFSMIGLSMICMCKFFWC